MEELQDAIEDAQYVNAITTQDDGPRPILTWDFPEKEVLDQWKQEKKQQNDRAFTLEWTLESPLGLFFFSAFVKERCHDYVRMNFVEEVARWRRHLRHERHYRLRHAILICSNYLEYPKHNKPTEEEVPVVTTSTEEDESSEPQPPQLHQPLPHKQLPRKTEIDEYDLERPTLDLGYTQEEFQRVVEDNTDKECKVCPVGLDGPVRDEVVRRLLRVETTKRAPSETDAKQPPKDDDDDDDDQSEGLPHDLFDKAEAIVMETLRRDYWSSFVDDSSSHYRKLLNFLWYQDRPVVPKDFFTMRVLGRGGFGLVTACKKGTSGKLYAMKIMSKKRIKMKKAQGLALNERAALAAVQSPFVVNLSYSFHSKDDIFLILDLMAGGDLGFHLQQKGRFPKRECIYYAARIMLGLQALHDSGYVYRDLKPENCLLAEDGRVKLTDFGLATKVTPHLRGAAGTRGYWAPEMLRRDASGKRMPYGHAVDWFSYGCCVAEFISGSNPFRSEAALNFGLERKNETKEKAIDCATLEMDPPLDPRKFDDDAADFCRRLLDKNEKTRLGSNGCEEIMSHPWFQHADWELISSDRKKPPFIPAKDVNAASQSEIGTFAEDKAYHETVLTEQDEEAYKDWDWTNPKAFAAEVIEFMIYERETGEPLVPQDHNVGCCCVVS